VSQGPRAYRCFSLTPSLQKQMKQQTPHEHCREVTISIAFVHHQSSPSSLCSRNRPSVCIHNFTHHMAVGSGHQTAQQHTTITPTSPFSLRKVALRTAGSGQKPVTLTRQSAIWHRSRETASLTMLTTYHHSQHSYIFYRLACCPHHLFSTIWYNRGGLKVPSAYQRSPQSSLNEINQ
jgi:hypothetical protein